MSQLICICLLSSAFLLGIAFGSPLESAEPKLDATDTSSASKDTYEERLKLLIGNEPLPECKENTNNINECLKNVFNVITPRIKDGIPELNILPIEPFKLNRTTFQFQLPIATGRLSIRNAEIHGLSDFVLDSVDLKVDGDKVKFISKAKAPKMRIVGDYKAQIRLATQTTFKPKGKFELELTNIENVARSESEFYEKDGHKFVRIIDFDSKPKIGDLKVNITGVFEDPELNELALSVAEGYWREIYRIMLPETRDYWAPLSLRLMNEALSVIPYDAFVKSK